MLNGVGEEIFGPVCEEGSHFGDAALWLWAARLLNRAMKPRMCAPASPRVRRASPISKRVESSTRTIAYLKRPSFDSGSGPHMSMWTRRPVVDSQYLFSTWLSRRIVASVVVDGLARTLASDGGASAVKVGRRHIVIAFTPIWSRRDISLVAAASVESVRMCDDAWATCAAWEVATSPAWLVCRGSPLAQFLRPFSFSQCLVWDGGSVGVVPAVRKKRSRATWSGKVAPHGVPRWAR